MAFSRFISSPLNIHKLKGCAILTVFLFLTGNVSSQTTNDLASILQSGTVEQKRNVLSSIRSMGTAASAQIAVIALSDKNEIVRAMAANDVVYLAPEDSIRLLSSMLADRSEFVRREAVFALGETGSPAAVEPVSSALENDRSPLVRASAAIALGRIGDVKGVIPLIEALKRSRSSKDDFIRRSAARSLGQIAEILRDGHRQTATPQSFLPQKYKPVSSSSPATAIFPGFIEATRILIEIAGDSKGSEDTRREAAYALGSIGDSSALQFLQFNVTSPDPYLAEICREALLKMPPGT